MMKKKLKITSTASPPLPTSTTTIASLPDDVVEDILLRLPSAAAICRAVFAYKHWFRVAKSSTFLRRLRDIHNYPLLLGHFVSAYHWVSSYGHGTTPPHFYPAPLHSEADGILAAMVRRGDFLLTRIRAQGRGQHVLEDCRRGLLLFSESDARTTLRVFNPMTHRVSSVEQLPGGADHRGRTLCLLPSGDDPDAFRVISMQHRNRKKLGGLEVYDSCARAWRVLAGAGTDRIPPRSQMAQVHRGQYSPAMQAGHRIYWRNAVALLSLDSETMAFSEVLLPPGVTHQSGSGSAYAVGETEDGTCCLVHVFQEGARWYSRRMQVWRFKSGDGHDGNGAQMWELDREVPVPSLGSSDKVDQILAIVGGIVLLCFDSSSPYQLHVAFRLKSLEVEAKFSCRGLAHPYVIE